MQHTQVSNGSTVLRDHLDYDYAEAGGTARENVQSLTETGGRTTVYSYDQLSRLAGATITQTGKPTESYTYTYDAASNRTLSVHAIGGSWSSPASVDRVR